MESRIQFDFPEFGFLCWSLALPVIFQNSNSQITTNEKRSMRTKEVSEVGQESVDRLPLNFCQLKANYPESNIPLPWSKVGSEFTTYQSNTENPFQQTWILELYSEFSLLNKMISVWCFTSLIVVRVLIIEAFETNSKVDSSTIQSKNKVVVTNFRCEPIQFQFRDQNSSSISRSRIHVDKPEMDSQQSMMRNWW